MNLDRRGFLGLLAGAGFCAAWEGCSSLAPQRGPKLALNASTLRGYGLGLYDQVKAALAGGFTGYEPWLKDVHAAKADGTFAKAVALARAGGLTFVNGIAFGQWASPDVSVRAAGLEETKRDMAALAEMGCPYVAASMFGLQKPGSPIQPQEAIAERFLKVCALGDEMGVRPLLEYWGHSVNLNRPEDALTVLKLVGRADAALLADVYHTYRGGGDFATFRRFTATSLPVLHVNDYPATPAREKLVDADRVWPGDGRAPWGEIFANLRAGGADPWLSIEVFNPAYWKSTPEQTAAAGYAKLAALVKAHA